MRREVSYHFCSYETARLPEILCLESALWSSDPAVNSTYFHWKYEQNPLVKEAHLYLALHRDRVVGVRGFHGTALIAGRARRFVAPTGGDSVIVPRHQGRGLFERLNRFALARLAAEGFRIACNFSAGHATYLRSWRSGWQTVGVYCPWQRERRGHPRPGPPEQRVDIEAEPRPAAMAALARERENPDTVRLWRSASFLKWRYRNPLSRYHFLYIGGDPLEGYMVLQERLMKPKRGMRIVDWECREAGAFELLLRAAISRVDPECLMIWSATLPGDIQACLTRNGFQPVDDTRGSRYYRPGPLLFVLGDGSDPQAELPHGLCNPAAWRLHMICSDNF